MLEVLNKKRQLSQRRHRCRGVPLDMDTAGKSIGDRRPLLYLRLLTRRVNDQLGQICSHSSLIRRFGHSAQPPTAGFRFNVSRTVDGAIPTRRAISLSPTPALLNRSTSRTRRISILSAGIHSPVQKPKERTLTGPAEASPNRARSSRNGGRNHLGTPSDIKSEW